MRNIVTEHPKRGLETRPLERKPAVRPYLKISVLVQYLELLVLRERQKNPEENIFAKAKTVEFCLFF